MSKEETEVKAETKTIEVGDSITVHELAERLEQTVSAVITELMKNGVMATINDSLDRDTAAIIASEFDTKVTAQADVQEEGGYRERNGSLVRGWSARRPAGKAKLFL